MRKRESDMEMALISAEQVFVMFLLVAAGFFLEKRGVFTKLGTDQLNKLVILFVVPAVLIDSYNRPYNAEEFLNLMQGLGLSAVSILIALGVGYLFIRGEDEDRRIERFSVMLSNGGFMGIPLITAVLGRESVIYASSYIVCFTVFQWCVGPVMLKGREPVLPLIKKILINPGVLSVAAGLIIFRFSIPIPRPVSSALEYAAGLNTPIPMILVGTAMARSRLLDTFKNPRVYLVSALSLIVAPLLMLPVYLLLRPDTTVMLAILLASSCPIGAATAIFPVMYGYDSKYASRLITVSTLLSVITIPLMVYICQLAFGL